MGEGDPVVAALDSLAPRSAEERADLDRLRSLPAGGVAWDRSEPLHLTGSAMVVHPPSRTVLLRWHERQQAWMQVGGHGDPGESDPLAIAVREGIEETGLADLRPWPDAERPALVQAVIVSVPANEKEPAHEHGDLRYVLATDQPEAATPENETAALRWLSIDEALALTDEDNVADLLRRVGKLLDRERQPGSGPEVLTVRDALAALAAGDLDRAAAIATRIADRDVQSHLAAALARQLAGPREADVYREASAFEQFIDNGGNVQLYRQTISQVAAVHSRLRPKRVLDIGCGDGRAIAGALTSTTRRLDLVEPSADLLRRAALATERPGLEVGAHGVDATAFFAGADGSAAWDLTESTFALHTLDPDARRSVLGRLAELTSVLVVVEFDVPAFADRSPEHLTYLAERFEIGVREYEDHPGVISGFLLPVLLGQVDPDRPRHTFEQPAQAWARDLRAVGFTTTVRPVAPYWWADAVLIEARAPAEP